MAIQSDDIAFRLGVGEGPSADAECSGETAVERALESRDGFSIDMNGVGFFLAEMTANQSALDGLQNALGPTFPFFGGGCSGNRYASIRDEDFILGYQYINDRVLRHSVPLLLLSGQFKAAFGVAHGWRSYGKAERIGRCEGNTIYEIGKEPAEVFYSRYLGHASYTPYPLAFREGEKLVLRAVTGTAPNGGLKFTTGIPDGTLVRITRGSREDILKSARSATQEALAELGGKKARLGFIVSCISRHMAMGSRIPRELAAVQGYKTMEGVNTALEDKIAELNTAYMRLEQTHTQLRDAQTQLLDASRRAGMAEIASEVLHHVGNELNSLTVSVDKMSGRFAVCWKRQRDSWQRHSWRRIYD